MNSPEWPLIVFTILAQLSVGAFLVLGLVHAMARRTRGEAEADRLAGISLLAIGPALIAGMAASLVHLGSPMNAYGAVSNVSSSWLSREIASGVAFAVLGGTFAIAQARKAGSFYLRQTLAYLAALSGIALVYSMSQVYMLASQPAWNSFATPLGFFATTFLLGSLAVGSAFVVSYWGVKAKDPACESCQCEILRSSLRTAALVGLVMLGVEFVVLPVYLASLTAAGSAGLESLAMITGQFGIVLAARLVLVFLGAGVLGLFLYQSTTRPKGEGVMAAITLGAFTLVLASEVLGRFLFYATHVRIGI